MATGAGAGLAVATWVGAGVGLAAGVGAGPAGTPVGGAMVVTVGGVALEPSTGTPSSPSVIPPAASANGSRMTGCELPTNGNGIGCVLPANSTAGAPPDCGDPCPSGSCACSLAGTPVVGVLLRPGINQAAATATTTTAEIANTCFFGILNPILGRFTAERLAIMASIIASRATWLILPGQPSELS
ncbi:hypothetical protein D3C78_1359560 [compost metagenome]